MATRYRRQPTQAAISEQRKALRVLYSGEPVSREELAEIERRLTAPREARQRELVLELKAGTAA
jgi:hypothetical protein